MIENPMESDKQRALALKQAHAQDGEFVGQAHQNPMLDTHDYWVEFPDGLESQYTANVIAENLFTQVGSEERKFALINEIW